MPEGRTKKWREAECELFLLVKMELIIPPTLLVCCDSYEWKRIKGSELCLESESLMLIVVLL